MIKRLVRQVIRRIIGRARKSPALANTLGVICLLLIPLVGPWPGPGGIPLLLVGLGFLSLHNAWAARLRVYIQERFSSLSDLIFLENKICQWAWDIFAYLGLAGGIYVFFRFDFHFVLKVLLTTALGFIVVAWLRNRHRWRRLLKYFNLLPRRQGAGKAITLYQPWASLVAAGAKTFETRSWRPTPELAGQRIAIHAGKRLIEPGGRALARLVAARLGEDWRETVPRGAIIATAKLGEIKAIRERSDAPSKEESLLGEYRAGRWMWELEDIRPVEPPVPMRGSHKFWTLEKKI